VSRSDGIDKLSSFRDLFGFSSKKSHSQGKNTPDQSSKIAQLDLRSQSR